jgi:hypothetical protein
VHDAAVIPLPAEHNLFVCLEIAQRKDAERQSLLFFFFVFPHDGLILPLLSFPLVAQHRPYDRVRPAAAPHPAALVACPPRVQCDVDRWAHEVHVRARQARVRILVQRVGQVDGRRQDGAEVRRDERRRRERLRSMKCVWRGARRCVRRVRVCGVQRRRW